MSGDCKGFREFRASVGNNAACEFLEELCDTVWAGKTRTARVNITSSHTHNACNHTYSGTLLHDGIEYGFIIDNGDWNGTVVREWGLSDDIGTYEPPPPTIYTFVPTNDTLKEDRPAMWSVYLAWRKTDWFREKERGYNYDRTFAPGGKTESYYRDWAAGRGLKITSKENADMTISRPKRELLPMTKIVAAIAALKPGDPT